MARTRTTGRRVTALPLAGYSGHLQAAEISFKLLTAGPRPPSIDGRTIGHGLPARMIPLNELSAILLHPSTSLAARDAAWRVLVTRARSGQEPWSVVATAIAAPALWNVVKRLARRSGADHADVQSLVVEGFLAAINQVDLVRQKGVCGWLRQRARDIARPKLADAKPTASGRSCFAPGSELPPPQYGHPDLLLAKAVRLAVITAAEAELIGLTRLEKLPIAKYAGQVGCTANAATVRRHRAEARLVAALRAGDLSDPDAQVIAEATLTSVPDPFEPTNGT